MWAEVLSGLGPVISVVAPVAGPSASGSDEFVVLPSGDAAPTLPRLAQGLGLDRGRAVAARVAHLAGGVDLVVAVRSYVGLLGVGLRDATGARLVIDLDDDDASFFRSVGDEGEAARFQRLVDSVSRSADVVVSTQGIVGTRAVPNSVRIPATVRVAKPGMQRIALVANMGFEPNAAGARWFIESVLPLVVERVPGAELVIAGPGSESFAPFGRGYVADLDAVLGDAAVAIAPIRHGSGTRIKILDAWAHGRAVVSTTVGADGLGAVDGVHLLIADDAASFARSIVRVLEDASLAASLGSAGRELVADRFSRRRVAADVRDMLCDTSIGDSALVGRR